VLNPREVDAAAALRDHNQGRGADAVFVTASSLDAYNTGLSLCNRGGDLHLNAPGPSGSEWAIDPYDLFFREIAIHSAYSADHRATSSVVELLINGRVDPVPLITHRFGLDSLEEAIRLVLESRQSLKPMIIPSLTKRL
jgi:L-iditol 2-dehydrogenase